MKDLNITGAWLSLVDIIYFMATHAVSLTDIFSLREYRLSAGPKAGVSGPFCLRMETELLSDTLYSVYLFSVLGDRESLEWMVAKCVIPW
jgi:hypothetical protein